MEITPKGAGGDSADLGCYGLRIRGLESVAHYLGPVRSDDPELTVTIERGSHPGSLFKLSETVAELPLSDGVSRAVLDRSGLARVELARPYDHEALLHPLLSGCCAIFNWWHGRDAFHAG